MSSPNIALIDYGSGNLRSVQKALESCGARADLVSSPDDLAGRDAMVMPGVGAFGDCARNLAATGLWEPVKDWIASGRPYLGICVGYQLLFESSEENPDIPGLGVLAGQVKRFDSGSEKIPHMGWNTLTTSGDSPLFADLPNPVSVYFVHSYYPVPDDRGITAATCDYVEPFAAAISRSNLHGTQFHPEKSQRTGLAILANFLRTL